MAQSGKRYIVEKEKIAHNIRCIRQAVGEGVVYAVIKSNGYGVGCRELAGICAENGIRRFTVTGRREAEAAAALPHQEILMMTQVRDAEEIAALERLGVTFTVASADCAGILAAYCRSRQTRLRVHVKVDTGMGRRGFRWEDGQAIRTLYGKYPELDFVGIYTHFSDGGNQKLTREQYSRFARVLTLLEEEGIRPGLRHCCGSAATFRHPEYHLDGVRVGSALLGRIVGGGAFGLQRTGMCHVPVESVEILPKGATVGYGAVYRAPRQMQVAICAIGCHHGLGTGGRAGVQSPGKSVVAMLRLLKHGLLRQNLPYAMIHGVKCPVLGCIGTETVTLDVTGVSCQAGDVALFDINPLMLNDVDVAFQ